jgi:shikimate kinase
MSTVLIGYRGSGKTTIGRKLADHLWQKFVDTDEMIVASAGKPIAEIFAQQGESQFRDLETQALREASKLAEHVIALGGGAPIRGENRELIKAAGHRVIYLSCEPETLFKRIQADPETAAARPHLTPFGGSEDEIRKVLSEREPIYRQFADAEIDVTYLTPEEAMVYIVRLL